MTSRRSQEPVPPPLHDLEAEVMGVVWQHEVVTVRDVYEMVNTREVRQRAYTTFMTVMARLAVKGVLERHREGKTDIYRAVMSAEEYTAARARVGVGALVEEFGDLALIHFAAAVADMDPARRAMLERHATDD